MNEQNDSYGISTLAQAVAVPEYIEGGRESVDDALAVVESFGAGIEGVNDEFARQIILAAEVRRLRGLYEQAAQGRSTFRNAYRKVREAILPPLGCPACGITHDAKECPQEAAPASPAQEHATQLAGQGAPITLSAAVREFLQEAINDATQGEDADIDVDFAEELGKLLEPIYPAAPIQAQEDARDGLTQAARDVLAERHRQISAEGWTPAHDDEHANGDLAYAAGGYAVEAADATSGLITTDPVYSPIFPEGWEFKRSDPRRMLVKSAALSLAEIERLDRAAARAAQGGAA